MRQVTKHKAPEIMMTEKLKSLLGGVILGI